MSGNAWEYFILLRRSLLAEVEPRNNEDGDFDSDLKNFIEYVLGHAHLWFNRAKSSVHIVQRGN
jgi:hypothetical protein